MSNIENGRNQQEWELKDFHSYILRFRLSDGFKVLLKGSISKWHDARLGEDFPDQISEWFFKWEGGVSLSIQNLILKIFGVLNGFWPWFLENMQDGDAFVALCISSRRRRRRRGRDNFHREQQAAHSSTTAAMNGDHASGDDHHHYDDDDGYHEVRGELLSPGHTITIFYPVNFNHGHGTIGLECETMILLRARYYNISINNIFVNL